MGVRLPLPKLRRAEKKTGAFSHVSLMRAPVVRYLKCLNCETKKSGRIIHFSGLREVLLFLRPILILTTAVSEP